MKNTTFTHFHEKAGAKMVPFAGFNMPLQFKNGVTHEHMTVRKKAGVFDVSHMGEVWIKGERAFDLLQKVTVNNVAKLEPGKVQYTCMPNGKGGIVDDLLLYRYEEQKYMIVPNASNIDKVVKWLEEQNEFGAIIENASSEISQLAIQGPLTNQILQPLTDVNLDEIKPFTFVTGKFAGCEDVIISATGYTGAGGFELYMYNKDGVKIWEEIMKAGEAHGIEPIGLAARDTLRLEMGFCLYGNDIDDTTSPIEANLGWITKFVENKKFVDRELLAEQKANKPDRLLKGFIISEKGIPRKGYDIVDGDDNKIGFVTSGTQSPVLKKGIGMGYINKGFNKNGTEIFIKIRNKNIKATVTAPPFIG